MVFFVNGRPDNEGFHEIKDANGNVIATAANTCEQALMTLDALGFSGVDIETIYDQNAWDSIGKP